MATTRQINLGNLKIQGYKQKKYTTITISLKNNRDGKPVFTASGNVWNKPRTDIVMGGQCLDEIHSSDKTFKKIYELWKKYHLNDMNAGTEEQSAFLKECEDEHNWDYTKCCEILEKNGLLWVDYNGKPYKYGTDWLYREIPQEDLETIQHIIDFGTID